MKRLSSTWLAAATSLLIAGTAHAQDTTKVAAAESLFQEAEKLEAEGKYDLACGRYAESQQLDPGLGTLLHLAQCYEKGGKLASAWGRYREAMELAVRAGDQRSEIARKRADALEPRLAKLTIAVPAANQVPGLAIARDGVAVGSPQWNLSIPVDPGEHVIVASAPGHLPSQAKVVAPGGAAQLRVEIPKLAVDPAAEDGKTTGSSGSAQRVVGITLAGTGAAALIVGGVLGITAKVEYDKSDGECSPANICSREGINVRDSASGQATASTILFIAGGALVAGGAVLFFTAPKARPAGSATLSAPRVGVSPAGLIVRGTF